MSEVTSDPTRTFRRVLANTLLAGVTTTFLWFALTFWVYLETRSVLAASLISGLYMLVSAAAGSFFGAIVDAHRKKTSMVLSSTSTLLVYLVAGLIYLTVPVARLVDFTDAFFWLFNGLVLIGGVMGSLRSIALSTTVTLLVPADRRDKANGMVGTVNGLAHMATSVFSGLAIGFLGMGGTIVVSIVLTAAALLHLATIRIDEPHVERSERSRMDVRGTWRTIRAVPGLWALILFAAFNNLVMGVFMALTDPYGLTLFSVETWGIVLGVVGIGFIAGGACVARFGLGRSPLRTLLLVNMLLAVVGVATAIRGWQLLLVLGMFGFMFLIPVAEAAEQTILQRVVPFERQGRVFGLAQSVESAAAPVSSFVIGPLAQLVIIPFMTTDAGRTTFGWLLGDGPARGIALAFVAASLIMLVTVLAAFFSAAYRRLNRACAETEATIAPVVTPSPVPVAA